MSSHSSSALRHPNNVTYLRPSIVLACVALFTFTSMTTGCGSKLPTVEGTVTMDGAPLSNAKVVFESPDRPMAVATTDESGQYDVHTGSGRGIAAGSYRVAISAYATKDGGTESPMPILTTPRRYNSAQTSGLTAEIVAGRNQDVDFLLESK